MDQTQIGKFIAKRRKDKRLTQAQLAEMLNITDRAVSKWETGKSMPDSSIMLELCKILDISVNELLSGEEISKESFEQKADENLLDMQRKDENNISKNMVITSIFSAVLLVGVTVCIICDLAVGGKLTWSAIPILSVLLVWAVCIPTVIMGKKGLAVSMGTFSALIIPFLYLLSRFLRVWTIFSMGSVVAGVAVIFIWILAALFKRIGKDRIFVFWGVTFLLLIIFEFIMNIVVSWMLLELTFNLWDMLSVFVLFILTFICFLCDYAKRKGMMK